LNIAYEFDYHIRLNRVIKEREIKNYERRRKIQALINDTAATEGEKQAARAALKRIM
jgi:hypothetical protein